MDNVSIAESHTFNIVSNKKGDKGSQQLYEFRISLQFKSVRTANDFDVQPPQSQQNMEKFEKKLISMKSLFNQESHALIRPPQLSTILKNLSTIARRANVSFDVFKPDETTRIGPVLDLPINIKVKGTYPQMDQFLKHLAKDQHTIGLTGVQIEPDLNNVKSTDITLSGYLNFFTLHSDQGKPLNYALNSLEPNFPKKIKRTVHYVKLGQQANDPFHTFKLDLPKPKTKATEASIACQSNRNIRVHLSEIRYLGLLRQYGGNAALLRIRNRKTIKLKEGQCLNKSISISKIMRSKVIIKQTVADPSGRVRSRTVALNKAP